MTGRGRATTETETRIRWKGECLSDPLVKFDATMSDDTAAELEARLAEQDTFEPPESFVEQANVADPAIYDEFEEEGPDAWERAAELLDVSYDIEAWASADTGGVRSALEPVLPQD